LPQPVTIGDHGRARHVRGSLRRHWSRSVMTSAGAVLSWLMSVFTTPWSPTGRTHPTWTRPATGPPKTQLAQPSTDYAKALPPQPW